MTKRSVAQCSVATSPLSKEHEDKNILLESSSVREKGGDCGRSTAEQGYQLFPQEGRLLENSNLPLNGLPQRTAFDQDIAYCYVIDSVKSEGGHFVQWGSGPNFQGDVITLCTCKHHMRTSLSPYEWEGRWVAGFTGVGAGGGRNALVYLMKVGHAFESHYDLWYSEEILPETKQAKSARLSTYGDLFEPLDQSSDPFDYRSYHLPHEAHSHAPENAWHGDVDRTGYSGRRAALLVGDPEYSFLWDRPMAFFPSSIGRGYRKIILSDLLSWLEANQPMKMAMLRVGIDTGSGGIHGPLFRDGSFEFVPIPDSSGTDPRTYGNMVGRKGRSLIEYFPTRMQDKMRNQSVHADPEFETFTYGDPTSPKAGLRHLEQGDMLVFYCGLQRWDFASEPGLYLIGYFEVLVAKRAGGFSPSQVQDLFGKNFHVRHREVFEQQKDRLVLVKGSPGSRLLQRAELMSEVGKSLAGKPLKVISSAMQEVFGDFNGKLSFQRSPTRWVDSAYVARAAQFVKSLY